MEREEIVEVANSDRPIALAVYRDARAALRVGPSRKEHDDAHAAYQAALLKNDTGEAAKAQTKLQLLTDQDAALEKALDQRIAQAEAAESEADYATKMVRMREMQRRGLKVGAEIHTLAQKLVELLDEHAGIERRIRAHNSNVRFASRSEFAIQEPMELLGLQEGIYPALLPQPADWEISGYWSRGARVSVETKQLGGFVALASAKPQKQAA